MKRRRGNKKGRPKKQKSTDANDVASNVLSIHTEGNSAMDEHDNDAVESSMDAKAEMSMKAPSPSGLSQPDAIGDVDPVPRSFDKPFGKAVYKRVRVKIKNSKNIENLHNASNAPAQSDTEKHSTQVGSEKHGVLMNEKMEDSTNSQGSPGNITKKTIGIKIKSSRGFGSSCMSPCSNSEPAKGDEAEIKEPGFPHQESIYNEQELKAALEVIRKVMKMDAAAPFNAPVNPVALGIPDYFEVIETPMDFGTICSNLEKGVKYKNSEDVYKDVQYIWDNCLKYNNEGDHIVDLVKRVRRAFTKYWTALGLFSDQPIETHSGEKDLTSSNEGNTPANGVIVDLSGMKFHGLKKHKENCQCAICVMIRRRREREEIAHLMGGNSDDSLNNDDPKQEGIDSPFGEYTLSNTENSPASDMERKGPEMKLGNLYDEHNNNGDSSRVAAVLGQDGNVFYHQDQETPRQNGDRNTQQQAVLNKGQRAKMLENLRYLENPMLLDLYGTLFSQSFWNGPHSLCAAGHKKATKRKTSLHSAISSFTK